MKASFRNSHLLMLWEITKGSSCSLEHGLEKHLETLVSENNAILTIFDLLKNIQPQERINKRGFQLLVFHGFFCKCEV